MVTTHLIKILVDKLQLPTSGNQKRYLAKRAYEIGEN